MRLFSYRELSLKNKVRADFGDFLRWVGLKLKALADHMEGHR